MLEQISNGTLDPYEGYGRIYSVYIGSGGLAEAFKPLFRMPGVEPGGSLEITEALRQEIKDLAVE